MSAAVTTVESTTDRLAVATTGLEPDSALALRAAFEEMFANADRWITSARGIRVTSVDQKREMKMARESRLALREIRVKAEHARKRLKEDSTRRGKAIDGIANVLKALIDPIEEHLLEQETFAERAEDARKEELRSARDAALRALGADPAAYVNLGAMSEETWASALDAAKDAKAARDEAAKLAESVRLEAERLAAEARAKEKAEAARLEAERAERERVTAEENARLAKEKAEIEAAAKAEREKAAEDARAAKAAADRIAATQEEALKAERVARAEAEAEAARVKATADAERQAAERETKRKHDEDLAARQAAALAPDREKLAAFAATLRTLEIPSLSTPPGKAAAAKVADQIAKMASWVEKTGASL